jgi:hypothetical protein
MSVLGPAHEEAAGELREWWEDLWQRRIGSQVVVLKTPGGWGHARVLDRFAEDVDIADGPVTIVIRIVGGELPDGPGLQAAEVRGRLVSEPLWRRAAELLDVDSAGGRAELAVEISGLLIPAGALLLANRVAVMLRKLSERRAAGEGGGADSAATAAQIEAVARAARAVASMSRQVPVVVLIEDAERVDVDLAASLLENLMFRGDGQVLAVVTAAPGSRLTAILRTGSRVGLAGRVHAMDVDTDMSFPARAALARYLSPVLPEPVLRRIGERTGTFDDVLRVTGSQRLAEIGPADDPTDTLTVADAVIDIELMRGSPSPGSVLVAWAGGMVHPRQMAAALVAGGESQACDGDLKRSGSLVRLADPWSSRFAAQIIALPGSVRRAVATAFLTLAVEIYADPASGLVDRVVAGRAAHHVRHDLDDGRALDLLEMQVGLIADLEAAGDLEVGRRIATEAWDECPSGEVYEQYRQQIQAARMRLATLRPLADQDLIVDQLTTEALRGGAAIGLEALVWAAANLLGMPGRSEDALRLIDRITAELNSRDDLGDSGTDWRLLLGFRAGRAGHHSTAQQLLAPMLSSPDGDVEAAAMRVLRSVRDPFADQRLQIEMLQAELATEPSDEDDLLRIHAALAGAFAKVGDYRRARDHARSELPLRHHLQGIEHPATMTARNDLASFTGLAGDAAEARDQFIALLPDLKRVLGPEHPAFLKACSNLAGWTGEAGDVIGARDQLAALLPVRTRVLGSEHPATLTTRNNLASWTGEAGDVIGARDQFLALLPVLERVLGPEHRGTLTTRSNLAFRTGTAGEPAGARDQLAALLPVRERVLGPEHPDTLITRANLAEWTGWAGDAAGARDQLAALLPVLVRVLGPEHPDTLAGQNDLALWTGDAGNPAGARDQFAALLPVLERVAGPEHPHTLTVRGNLASQTAEAGDAAGARDHSAALLAVLVRVLGPEHPETLAVQNNLASFIGLTGDAVGARDQLAVLLATREQVLGGDHPDTLTTRANLAFFCGETGDAAGARDQFAALVPARSRVVGAEHPETLDARANLAYWTGRAGDAAGARNQFAVLLPARERIQGSQHPATLRARNNLARWTGEAGDAAGARDQFAALLPELESVLGSEHPDTQMARDRLAKWTELADREKS